MRMRSAAPANALSESRRLSNSGAASTKLSIQAARMAETWKPVNRT